MDKQRYRAWQTAVRGALAKMEKQQSTAALDNKNSQDAQQEMTILTQSARQKGMGLEW